MSHKQYITKKSKKRKSKTGLPPGSTIYTGDKISPTTEIEVFIYDDVTCEHRFIDIEELLSLTSDKKKWININGLHDEKIINKICNKYLVHYLYQEDILNVFQRPKVEEEENYIFTTFKALGWDDSSSEMEMEQISVLFSANTVITFQEKVGDHYDIIREKLKSEKSIIKTKPMDYLFYRIMDITVDIYYDILEKMGDYLEDIESQLVDNVSNHILYEIQNNKKDIMQLRKNIYPMRDVINKLVISEHILIEEQTKKYLKDVLDHTIQILETVENYRDSNVSLKDMYLNTMSNEMNRVMKTLTIISTFFIPLTFIVGVYGMNFKYMPELNWVNGYYLIWIIMITIVIALTIWFKRKGWF